jgi:hypothetical protein
LMNEMQYFFNLNTLFCYNLTKLNDRLIVYPL